MKANLYPDLPPGSHYSVAEAAAYLGVCKETVRLWGKHGKVKIRYHRVNGFGYLLGSDINRLWLSTK